jgi:hypothetical protein
MNAYREGTGKGPLLIMGNVPVDVAHWRQTDGLTAMDAVRDLVNVGHHPEMRGRIFNLTCLRGVQGFAAHGGDFRYQLAVERLTVAEPLPPLMRDGRLNGDMVDLHGASRLTLSDVLLDGTGNGWGGIKLGGGPSRLNALQRALIRRAAWLGLGANAYGGHAIVDVVLDECGTDPQGLAAIELRPGNSYIRIKTIGSGKTGALVTGEGVVTASASDFDRVTVDVGTTFVVDRDTRIGDLTLLGTGATQGRLVRV